MKKVLISIIFILLPFTSISAELAIVDIDYLIKFSKKGKNIQKDLKVKNDKVFDDFNLKEKKLKERENNIKSKKNVLILFACQSVFLFFLTQKLKLMIILRIGTKFFLILL